jgi:hypothetical protein
MAEITKRTPEEVVQGQLEAYNRRDLEKFLQFYSSEVQVFDLGDPTPNPSNLEAFRKLYADLFQASPNLHCELVNRMKLGRFVIDQERVVGLRNHPEIHAVAIYEVHDELISSVWFLKP